MQKMCSATFMKDRPVRQAYCTALHGLSKVNCSTQLRTKSHRVQLDYVLLSPQSASAMLKWQSPFWSDTHRGC